MPTSLRARIVFPVDRPPIAGGVVTIDGERIVAVDAAAQAVGPVQDLGDVALLPGLVNAHTHLEFSHLREPLGRPGMPLVEWLPLAIAERHNRGQTGANSIATGIRESIASGTCAIGEIASADAVAYDPSAAIDLTLLLEVIGFSGARIASALVACKKRFAVSNCSHRTGISPHAPYTVSPSLLQMLVRFAKEFGVPVAMHLAESEEELQLLASSSGPFQELLEIRSMWDPTAIPTGMKPMNYLRILANAPRALVIHGNYLNNAEHAYLAEHADRMSLVFCPRTHAYFAHPRYPLAKLLNSGVHVTLGTDSQASNPDLSILAEMRHVALTHSDVSPEAILRMATLSAAEALGRNADLGSVGPGKLANLIAVPARTDSLADIIADSNSPTRVWMRGREV